MSVQQRIEDGWYNGVWWLWLLFPLMVIFGVIASIRRGMYRIGVLPQTRVNAHVIVVGNISVGGNGKTPVVLAIAQHLITNGHSVGILSRGYGGSQSQFPYRVSAQDPAALVGDEPALMANRLNCPVIIDPTRSRGAQALVDLGCSVIICDDGMQHYGLARDMEIVVMDKRALGNGWLLPMGPLRETSSRLAGVDCIVFNGDVAFDHYPEKQHTMHLYPTKVVNVVESGLTLPVDSFAQKYKSLKAICGIGNPSRFYASLASIPIECEAHISFADHHAFGSNELPQTPLIMTEKDAVKCVDFAHPDWWYLQVDADLPNEFYTEIDRVLTRHQAQKV